MKKLAFLIISLLFLVSTYSQTKVRVYGYVIDSNNRGLELVNVFFEKMNVGTSTNQNGYYELIAEISDSATISYSMIGYQTIKHTITSKQKVVQITVVLPSSDKKIDEINVVGQRRQTSTLDRMDAAKLKVMPNASGGIESLLITFAGVSSNNELSSQYNVRGGSFDENIVYVNGIEVYRPLLVRAGQQEGLSFINPDMVDNVAFSAGGFDAKYGDKMSSVLDISYKKPIQFEASASMSLLGATAYVGSTSKRFTQMHGFRYKTSAYLLGTLDTQGEYSPEFFDYQTYLTYQLTSKTELSFLGNFSQNSFLFIPQIRETNFGTIDMARKLTIYFSGQEKDLFRTSFGAFTFNYKPTKRLKLSLLGSSFYTNENETFDITGEYLLTDVKMDLNEENREGENLGIGKYHEHARNRLNATVATIAHLGEYDFEAHKVRWGITLQSEIITDKISEWEWRDSAGYSMPFNDQYLKLYYSMKSSNSLSTWRTTSYLQDSYQWNTDIGKYFITGGVRANYWTFNNELLLSPRASISLLPNWEKDFSFRFATGVYYQAPFYKEIRDTITDLIGNVNIQLNQNIKAQRTVHFVVGGDHYFRSWGRPFKFTSEVYLKLADRIISYTVDNVRVRYSGENDAEAYTAGIDLKLFGELIPGADSWINLSLMDSKENLLHDSYVKSIGTEGNAVTIYPGWMPRPNEQRYTFSMMFQDYLPNNPKYKMQLKFIWSDGLPFGAPRSVQYRSAFRTSPYRRVDLGLSRVLVSGSEKLLSKPAWKHIENIWINFEVFNLLDIDNVNSYYWISNIYNQQMAVPNFLTGRQINFKVLVDFK